jgi:putative hydrolase of the HAD superfamily
MTTQHTDSMTRESVAGHTGVRPRPEPINAVFFDFADTLFSSRMLRDVHLHQLRFVADTIGVTASDDELRASYREGLGVAYRSVASRPYYLHRELFGQAFVAMARTFDRELGDAQVRDAVDRQYQATIEAAELRADCLDSLRGLRERGLHVQVVSNIDEEQLEELVRRLGLMSAIDACTSSESAQSCKPDPGIYECALEKARCTAAQVLFVGDSPAHDVTGPQTMGMLTALLVADARPGPEDCCPDFVIERLGQVVEIVDHEVAG